MGLRVGFHYHIPAEHRGGAIVTSSPQGRFLDSLGACSEDMVCLLHSPRETRHDLLDYDLSGENVRLVDIGEHCAVWRRSLHPKRYVASLLEWRDRIDILLLRGPSPLLPALGSAAQRVGLPVALLLVGSYVDGVDDLPQPLWRKELIRLWSMDNEKRQDRVAQRSLTFVNSRRLYQKYVGRIPRLVETRTTTLNKGDFFERVDTCQGRPVRLLYTGRYDRAKGLAEMVQALAHLVGTGHDVVLDLVGWDEGDTGVEEDILQLAGQLGVLDRVHNHGRKAVGPDLFAFYRRADVFLTASVANEGFPRTVWEAMAHSLPVVATRVGSIPDYISGAAELVAPRSASALAEGIERVIGDSALRRRHIASGMILARENTLEKRTGVMVLEMSRYVAEFRPSA